MKKLILSLVAASTLGIAIAAPLNQANAGEVNIGGYHFNTDSFREKARYGVYYKTQYQKYWQFKGEYGTRVEAEFSARRLRYNGYIARIERFYGGR
jgi:hypothetical protein